MNVLPNSRNKTQQNGMKILKYLINIGVICIVIYFMTVSFLLTDISCEYFYNTLLKAISFQGSWFLIALVITTVVNIIIEISIENKNYGLHVLTLECIHIIIFILTFLVNAFILYDQVCRS